MAKKSMVARENKRINAIQRYSKLRQALVSAVKSIKSSDEERWTAQDKLQDLTPNGSKVRHVRRCNFCGRPKAVYRRFGLCRLCLRKAAMRGDVPGLVKASW